MIQMAPLAETQWNGADIASLYRRVQKACLPYLPDLRTPDEDRTFFEHLVVNQPVWAAFGTSLIGFCAFRPGWIDHLYLVSATQRTGIGSALLNVALGDQHEVSLYVFQRNHAARSFYNKHGFLEVSRSDGRRNEEKEPDLLSRWQPSQKTHPPFRQR